jgi:hypothetical protein
MGSLMLLIGFTVLLLGITALWLWKEIANLRQGSGHVHSRRGAYHLAWWSPVFVIAIGVQEIESHTGVWRIFWTVLTITMIVGLLTSRVPWGKKRHSTPRSVSSDHNDP